MLWRVPDMWAGATCWIMGGGPSAPRVFGVPENIVKKVFDRKLNVTAFAEYYEPIFKKHVIGINNAYQLGHWLDVLFFGDGSWFIAHKDRLMDYPAILASCCSRFKAEEDLVNSRVKYISKDHQKKLGLTSKKTKVCWNHNSGAAAINLAVHFGAKRIILVGFDMKLDKNAVSHWHGAHYEKTGGKQPKQPPFSRHLQGFPQIKKDATEVGVEIFNLSPDSAIKNFPKISLEEALKL